MFFHGKHLFLRYFYCLLAYCGDCIFVICCHVTTNEERNIVFFVFFMENTYFYVVFSCLAYCAHVFFGMRSPNYWGLGTKPTKKQTFFVFFIENDVFLRRFLWLICLDFVCLSPAHVFGHMKTSTSPRKPSMPFLENTPPDPRHLAHVAAQ